MGRMAPLPRPSGLSPDRAGDDRGRRACAAACALIGQAHRRPYAGDPDLKRLRRDALDALMTLDRALYAKAFALFDADNPKEADRG